MTYTYIIISRTLSLEHTFCMIDIQGVYLELILLTSSTYHQKSFEKKVYFIS